MSTILWAEPIITHRPAIVRDFLRDLAKSELMVALPESAQRVLFYLASLIEKDGSDRPVTPARDTIAARTGLGVASVYRALSALQMKGHIQRSGQILEGSGYQTRFGNSPIFLGQTILLLFRKHLISHNTPRTSAVPAPNPEPSITAIDTYRNTVVVKEQSKSALGHEPKIPTDLRWLVTDCGLNSHDVVGLLSIAKRHGKRLQDVLFVKDQQIRSGSIRNLWGWLASLLSSTLTDYAWMARSKIRDAEKVNEENKKANEVDTLRVSMAGKRFEAADGTVYEIDGNGIFCFVRRPGGRSGAAPIHHLLNELRQFLEG
ncbi:MAG: hypothetical protein IPG66_17755 [Hydrogenophilales bacterium]|nr:hypothetical protein [Hydrogenophilales bacterium]